MGEVIYGVDISEKITPIQVRDAVIECFYLAHQEILEEIREYEKTKTEEEIELMKHLDVKVLVKEFFKEVGGDYEQPTKEAIQNVCEKLSEYAANFRDKKIIEKHYGEIMKLIEKLE